MIYSVFYLPPNEAEAVSASPSPEVRQTPRASWMGPACQGKPALAGLQWAEARLTVSVLCVCVCPKDALLTLSQDGWGSLMAYGVL